MGIHFTWDEEKNRSNQKKHGISFEEAATVSMMMMLFSNTTKRTLWMKSGSLCLE
jgi:hypothetical protein